MAAAGSLRLGHGEEREAEAPAPLHARGLSREEAVERLVDEAGRDGQLALARVPGVAAQPAVQQGQRKEPGVDMAQRRGRERGAPERGVERLADLAPPVRI